MSFPPPGSGQYPHYLPPPQYQPGQPPPQVLYNNAVSQPSPYDGYGKPEMYPSGMMPYPSYLSTYTQQRPLQPQQTRPPQTPSQQPLQPSSQTIQPRPRPAPQLNPQLQSPPPPQPPAPPPPAPPPPRIQQEELQHQFVNPAQLFVQQPLPAAPRSRYTQVSQYGEPTFVPSTSPPQIPPAALPAPPPAMPAHVTPAPVLISPKSKPKPKPKTQSHKGQANIKKPQEQPIVKAEHTPVKISPKLEVKQKPSTPIMTPKLPQPVPATYATPQATVPAPSPMMQANMQSHTSNKQIQSQHIEKKRQSIQPSAEKAGKHTNAKSTKPPVDYQVVLLSLADEFLNAAHSRGTTTSLASRESDVEEYYKLVATGLGCLEAVLKVRHCLTRECLHTC
ncbi:hypothetical protein N7461_007730 [Penicillium sp. DV-2018c]|nr:hypothetical protein N7461_007730 [Penicillium sp. DV-2018c]